MGRIIPIGKLLRIPSAPMPTYAPVVPPPQAPAAPPAGGNNNNTTTTGGSTPPTPEEIREQNIEGQRFGLSGLIGTSLRGLFGFSGKLPKRKTLLGE